ncbi:MAG: hypothetical protein K2I79_04520, partial [Clostridia bacterium]|nr:hypothetical protein [Clostridia bacterium]
MIDLPINTTYGFNTDNISQAKDIGDILLEDYTTRSDGKVFNVETLQALYEQITGKKNATLDDIGNMIDDTATSIEYGGQRIVSSNNIRETGDKQDILLNMVDGMQWTVTSLVKVGSDIIATLWRADSNVRNATTGEETSYNHVWSSVIDNTTNVTYPSNVYGTSYIRAEGLNIGGGYVAAQGASSLTTVNQSATHPYAKFTMSNVTGSLTNFLVKPSQVAYQGVENQTSGSPISSMRYTLANEAYGTPTGTQNWYSNSSKTIDMSTLPSKAGYTNWKDDLIWLPSLTETGFNNSVYGLWGLSDNQRSSSANSFVRSCTVSSGTNDLRYIYAMDANGTANNPISTSARAVRPALHLNLSSAELSAGWPGLTVPEDFEVTYNGEEQGISAAK